MDVSDLRKLKRYSAVLTDDPSKVGPQASVIRALIDAGYSPDDINLPLFGVFSVYMEGNPCNSHALRLAEAVVEGIKASGAVGFRGSTVGVSDQSSMQHDGMRMSLWSRELIAESLENWIEAHAYDGIVGIPGCDKNMPAMAMAGARLNRPMLIVLGGPRTPSCQFRGRGMDVQDTFDATGLLLSGAISKEERDRIRLGGCGGAGWCDVNATATTMGLILEAQGFTLPGSATTPATSDNKLKEARCAGEWLVDVCAGTVRPRDLMSEIAFRNAVKIVIATKGSTNAILHLLAMSRIVNPQNPLTLDIIDEISAETPVLVGFRPGGDDTINIPDFHNQLGGSAALIKFSIDEGFLDGSAPHVLGTSMAEAYQDAPELPAKQKFVRNRTNAFRPSGHIRMVRGNFGEGVAKVTGAQDVFKGPARVFESEEDFTARFDEVQADDLIVIRGEGPASGFREMLGPSSLIASRGMDNAIATDGRYSGVSRGSTVGHITPEARRGGRIGLLRDGDRLELDVKNNRLAACVTEEEFARRQEAGGYQPPETTAETGTGFSRYCKHVGTASEGCLLN